jgi:tRNA A37 threonylcarbamoyladenosine modification protein TsaB
MYLLISTENNSHFSVAIGDQEILKFKTVAKPYKQAELLLKTISSLLPPTSYNLKAIFVVVGPGGFSAVRIGVSTANALAYALKIPIVGIQLLQKDLPEKEKLNLVWNEALKKLKTKKVGAFAKPYYDQEPHITQKKK